MGQGASFPFVVLRAALRGLECTPNGPSAQLQTVRCSLILHRIGVFSVALFHVRLGQDQPHPGAPYAAHRELLLINEFIGHQSTIVYGGIWCAVGNLAFQFGRQISHAKSRGFRQISRRQTNP